MSDIKFRPTCSSCGYKLAENEAHPNSSEYDNACARCAAASRSLRIRFSGNQRERLAAQDLYDLRTMTGFCSGQDLHALFSEVVGEPSPSGKVQLDHEKMLASPVGRMALTLLDDPLAIIRSTSDYLL